MRRKVISTHYLRRRAEARAEAMRAIQGRARVGAPGARMLAYKLGINGREIAVRKRGKWDARYDVIATPREETP